MSVLAGGQVLSHNLDADFHRSLAGIVYVGLKGHQLTDPDGLLENYLIE